MFAFPKISGNCSVIETSYLSAHSSTPSTTAPKNENDIKHTLSRELLERESIPFEEASRLFGPIKAVANINVICRIRRSRDPQFDESFDSPLDVSGSVVECAPVSQGYPRRIFHFDRVFDWTTSQEEIFTSDIKFMLDSLLAGFNATVGTF
jgi:hypothetical protein